MARGFSTDGQIPPLAQGAECVAVQNCTWYMVWMDLKTLEELKRLKYRYLRTLDSKQWDEFADTLNVAPTFPVEAGL